MALGVRRVQKEPEEDKTIEINAQMQGSLNFKDPVNLKINGNFHGSLETKGTLTIGQKAIVDANIKGDNIVVAGKIKGDVIAHTVLVLMPTAILEGNIITPKLNIVEGAIFQGSCQMKNEISSDDLLDIVDVAKYLEIDLAEIEKLANSGKIPAQRFGNSWKFERAQIDQWASTGMLR